MATPLRIDEGRKRLAREQVEQLAKQTGHLIAVAQKVYDVEYDKLRDDAKVTDFVAVLALRHTRERLLALQKNRRASAANASYELFSA
ncbi:MAG TPA: hypothetical protein VN989_09425 [Casimicrobiaceae bacterium]|jgi:hypothetical protein|nr:hypothetical protein [Casimicrobiaceae bacterium]